MTLARRRRSRGPTSELKSETSNDERRRLLAESPTALETFALNLPMFTKQINLEELVADALAQHPDATRDELEAALVGGVETTCGRRLTEYEKAKIGVEVGCAWNRRCHCSDDEQIGNRDCAAHGGMAVDARAVGMAVVS